MFIGQWLLVVNYEIDCSMKLTNFYWFYCETVFGVDELFSFFFLFFLLLFIYSNCLFVLRIQSLRVLYNMFLHGIFNLCCAVIRWIWYLFNVVVTKSFLFLPVLLACVCWILNEYKARQIKRLTFKIHSFVWNEIDFNGSQNSKFIWIENSNWCFSYEKIIPISL